MSEQHDADELAKFFRWLEENGGIDPLSYEANALCEHFKNGRLIIIFGEPCEAN